MGAEMQRVRLSSAFDGRLRTSRRCAEASEMQPRRSR